MATVQKHRRPMMSLHRATPRISVVRGRGRTASLFLASVVMIVALLTAGCGSAPSTTVSLTTQPSTTVPPATGPGGATLTVEQALARPDGSQVAVSGSIVVQEGVIRLCSGLAESYPPQCAGASIEVRGWKPDEVVGLTATGGAGGLAHVAWSDFPYLVVGTLRDGVLEVAPAPIVTERYTVKAVGTIGGWQLRLRFSHSPATIVSRSRVQWLLDATNESDRPAPLQFASGQKGEVKLKSGSEIVYTWSEGRAFTEAVQQITLEPGATVGFVLEEESLKVGSGEYECAAAITFQGPLIVMGTNIIVK